MMYKILHLPTGTYLKLWGGQDWCFVNLCAANTLIIKEPIVVDYESDIVVLKETLNNHMFEFNKKNFTVWSAVFVEQLEIVEVPDV